MHIKNLLTFGLITVLLLACQQATIEKSEKKLESLSDENSQVIMSKPVVEQSAQVKDIWIQATVKHMNFEGGFFGLITKQGEKLLPMNLNKSFHQEGAIIRIQGRKQKNVMTIQQWGTPFEITHIELIKAGSATPKSEM